MIEDMRDLEPIPEQENDFMGYAISSSVKPPLNRVLRQGGGHFCTNCGSTSSKVGFFGLFGERLCDNQKCPNSKSKKNYRSQFG